MLKNICLFFFLIHINYIYLHFQNLSQLNTNSHILTLLALLLPLLAALPSASAQHLDSIPLSQNEVWQLRSIKGKKIRYKSDNDRITLSFNTEASTFSGNSGCNPYGGFYSLKQDRNKKSTFSLSDISIADRACPDGVSKRERQFISTLARANSFRRDSYSLILLDNGKEILEFELIDN